MPRVLIAAAGGRVARRVAAALCARGEPPRALVRDAAKARDLLIDNRGAPLPLEMVVSELTDRDGVRRTLAGTDIAFLALGSSLQQVEVEQGFINVAAEVGLPHLVKLSIAEARGDGVASVLRWRAAIESHLAVSGVPHTLLSPSTFADILMYAAPSIREMPARTLWGETVAMLASSVTGRARPSQSAITIASRAGSARSAAIREKPAWIATRLGSGPVSVFFENLERASPNRHSGVELGHWRFP